MKIYAKMVEKSEILTERAGNAHKNEREMQNKARDIMRLIISAKGAIYPPLIKSRAQDTFISASKIPSTRHLKGGS